ncbi:hypothetical protein [Marinagarivorans algicola]|uniref:hypothetical protein n=1 Tax=Marinagarivorans algicola TaxID=1513270 RepID=UPI0012E21370|nr:hypothetical protein [Marinagarivorans algicola]
MNLVLWFKMQVLVDFECKIGVIVIIFSHLLRIEHFVTFLLGNNETSLSAC